MGEQLLENNVLLQKEMSATGTPPFYVLSPNTNMEGVVNFVAQIKGEALEKCGFTSDASAKGVKQLTTSEFNSQDLTSITISAKINLYQSNYKAIITKLILLNKAYSNPEFISFTDTYEELKKRITVKLKSRQIKSKLEQAQILALLLDKNVIDRRIVAQDFFELTTMESKNFIEHLELDKAQEMVIDGDDMKKDGGGLGGSNVGINTGNSK
jgi:DNA polymerase elongation subunit (family B)